MNILINDIPLSYFLLSLVGGYLLGSIPFGLLLARLGGEGDIRKIGSGNIGATNVLRTGNKFLALLTLLLDGGKGAAAALIAATVAPELALIAAGAAFLGHLYPVFLKFKGGKGVATYLGLLLALSWPVGLLSCLVWFLSALIFRISSLAALIAALAAPLYSFYRQDTGLALLSCILCLLIFYRHLDNMKRLIKGVEPKIGKK